MMIVFALLLLLISLVSAEIEIATYDNFDSLIHSGRNGMVKFYQDWCGHCKRMAPAWQELADAFGENISIFIADVNCGEQEELCRHEEIKGYPTIKYFVRGEEHEYNGGRGADELIQFVNDNVKQRCIVTDLEGSCSKPAIAYASKWMSSTHHVGTIKEIKRLKRMVTGDNKKDMNPKQIGVFLERIDILEQVVEHHKDELTEL